MKNLQINISYDKYEKDWRLGFIRFLLQLLGFRKSGSAGGDVDRWSELWNIRNWKVFEVDERGNPI